MKRACSNGIFGRGTVWSVVVGLWLFVVCSPTSVTDGGGTRGGNPVVTGTIAGIDGIVEKDVRVSLITKDYDPVVDAPLQVSSIDTTDELGKFAIEVSDSGWYTVEAVGKADGARLLRFNIRAVRDSVVVLPVDTLRKTGAISFIVPGGSDTTGGYVYVPGTSIAAKFTGSRDTVRIDSVPRSVLPELIYVRQESAEKSVVSHDIPVVSGETTLIINTAWNKSRRIILNTTSAGAGVEGNVAHFPVLVRLRNDNFDFTGAGSAGSDIMFTGRNNVRLPYDIERWDPVAGLAEVWVKVDTIFGNDSTQSIMMYWGASNAAVQEYSGPAVFDTAAGFQGVWHLSDTAQDSVRDATVNRYHGGSPDTAHPVLAEGVIGNCRVFDGKTDFVTMPGTADGKLNFPESGNYTVSAWVRLDTLDNKSHCIVSKGYQQYYLRSTYITKTGASPAPLWEFVEFSEAVNWQTTTGTAEVSQWALVVGVRQGDRQLLYCNGVLVNDTFALWNTGFSRITTNDIYIGKFKSTVNIPISEGYCYFRGGIDEVRLMSAAQSPDWIRLCYMNQRPDDRLVVFK